MTLDEIKTAVDAGETVHWANKGYTVIKDNIGQYLIAWHHESRDAHYIGLTHQDGTTMNGRWHQFFIPA